MFQKEQSGGKVGCASAAGKENAMVDNAVNVGERAAINVVENGVIGSILVISILALVALVFHVIRAASRERSMFHEGLEVERERGINTLQDFNEFMKLQNQMVDKVVQENRDTRNAFQHALDKILSAIEERTK